MTALLDAAEGLLSGGVDKTRGIWPRATAFLIRGALEDALDRYWEVVEPGVQSVSKRAQMLLLPAYVEDPETLRQVRETWLGLSRACHHHAYELAPTAPELRAWLAAAYSFTAFVERRTTK